jgi:hypothetical protein
VIVKWFILFVLITALVSTAIIKFGDMGSYTISEGMYFKAEILSVKKNRSSAPARTSFISKLNFTALVLNTSNERVEVGGMWKTEKGDIVCVTELINSESEKVINYLIVADEKCT